MKHSKHFPFWVLLSFLLLERIVVLFMFNHEWVDSDQTLFWIAAKEYSQGNFHQPFLFGQNYIYAVESLLSVPLLWCNVPEEWALPIVTNFLAIIPFVSFAFSFRKKGLHLASIVVLAIPLLLPVSYTLITSMPRGFIGGLAVFAFWPLIENVRRLPIRSALFGLVLVIAIVINPNVIFCATLLAGLAFFRSENKFQFIAFLICGGLLPATLHFCAVNWASTHDSELVHHAWDLYWNMDYFTQTFKDTPFAFFRGVIPFTETIGLITGFVFLALPIYAIVQKKYVYATLGLIIFAGIIFCLSINKVSDGGMSIFFPRSRMYLALPLVLALLLVGLVNERRFKLIAIVLTLLAGGYTCFQLLMLKSVIEKETHLTELIPLNIHSMDELKSKSDGIYNLVSRDSIQFIAGHTNPYGIGELQLLFHSGEIWHEDFPECAIPEHERRSWKRAEILEAPANVTLWLGGSDQQWANVDTSVGPVTVVKLLDMNFHRVHGENITNHDVYRVLRMTIGLPE